MNEVTPHQHAGRSRLVLGLFLLALGALMLAINLGYHLPVGWWKYFPAPFVLLGLWGLILPNRHLERSGGVWLLAIGIYCFIGIFDLWRLGWGTAWPIFIIAAGVSFIVGRQGGDEQPRSNPPPAGG